MGVLAYSSDREFMSEWGKELKSNYSSDNGQVKFMEANPVSEGTITGENVSIDAWADYYEQFKDELVDYEQYEIVN